MKSINLARFKAQLSRYIRAVRRGDEILLTDRNLPVAKIIPICEDAPFKLTVRKALKDPALLARLRFPAARRGKTDSLAFLLEERGSDR